VAVALSLLAGCDGEAPKARATPSPAPRPSTSPTEDPCLRPPEFRATFVPKDWHGRLLPGAGGAPGTNPPGLVGHYGGKGLAGTRAGARRGFIDVYVQPPFAQSNKTRIRVLGSRGTLGDIHEGYSVEFSYRGCDYALLAYGIEREEFATVARGLEPTNP